MFSPPHTQAAAAGPLICRIEAGSLHLAVDCGTPAIFAAVSEQLAPWRRRASSVPAPAARWLGARARRDSSGYVLAEGPQQLATSDDLPGLIDALQYWLDHEITRLPDFTPIHAGVVVLDGRAIVLPGASGSGKTTLVAALVAMGAHYFSDEYALLDDAGRVHAYPRRLRLPAGDEPAAAAPRHEACESLGALAISAILALRFVAGAELQLQRVPASEAAVLLLRNTPHRLGERSSLRSRVLRAVASTRTFEGVRGEAPLAADAILATCVT